MGRAKVQVVNRQPTIGESRIGSQVSPCEIYGGQNGTGTDFSPSSYAFRCQCHSTNALYSYSSTRCSYQKGKEARPGNLPKKQCSSVDRGERDEYFHFLQFNSNLMWLTCAECIYLPLEPLIFRRKILH